MLEPLTPSRAHALLSPSARVLVAAADADDGVARAAALPWCDVHWPTLISLTSFERAEAQVYRLLRAAPVDQIPDDVLHAMQGICRVSAFRAGELSSAAGVAADAFRLAGLTVLWLKGAALAMQSAEAFAIRSMGDLDVLVPPGQLAAARAALRSVGWRDGVADGSYEGHHHDSPMFWHAGIRLELHTGLFPPGNPFPDESADVWLGRSRSHQWGDREVRVLPRPWHVVHASVHWAWNHEGAVGSWQYLHDLRCLTDGWDSGSPMWSEVASHAETIRATAPVGWALWTGVQLGPSGNIDETVMSLLRGPRRSLTGIAEREWVLRAFQSPTASPSVKWSRYWWQHAMHGLGNARQEWPWTAGRALPSVTPDAVAGRTQTSPAAALTKWRRHLARVLRG